VTRFNPSPRPSPRARLAGVQVRVEDMIYISDRAFTAAEVRECELAILHALDHRVGMPTSYIFAARLLKAVGAEPPARVMVQYMLEHSLQEFVTLRFLPSLLAAAAVYVALRHWRGVGCWNDDLRAICPWTLADMAEPVDVLRRLYGASSNPTLTAVVKKFNTPRHGFVSSITLPPDWEMETDPQHDDMDAGSLFTPAGGSGSTPGTVGSSTMRGLDRLTLASGGSGGAAEREAMRRERRAAALSSGVELTLDTSSGDAAPADVAATTPRKATSPASGRTSHQSQLAWRWLADAVTCGNLATPSMLVRAQILVDKEPGAVGGSAGTLAP